MQSAKFKYREGKIKGIYVLFIRIKRDTIVGVGSLGKVKFNRGSYAYVGSAQNGIEKRMARHLKREKKKFWHIDYLLAQRCVKIEKIAYKEAPRKEECKTAQTLFESGEPIIGFGCSDCSCQSHLFKINSTLCSLSNGVKEIFVKNKSEYPLELLKKGTDLFSFKKIFTNTATKNIGK